MSDLVGSYLSRLEKALQRQMPKSVAEEHVGEIAVHLRESIAEQVQAGKTEAEATIAALQKLGNDAMVADGLIRAHTGIGRLSSWRLGWIPAVILLVYLLVPGVITDIQSATPQFAVWAVFVPLCLIMTFVFACWRSRRVLMLPIAAALSIFFIAAVLQEACAPYGAVAKHHGEHLEQMAVVGSQIEGLTTMIAEADSLQAGKPINASPRAPGGLMAPKLVYKTGPTGAHPYSAFELTPVASQAEAKELWSKEGGLYLWFLHRSLNHSLKERRRLEAENQVTTALVKSSLPMAWVVFQMWLCIGLFNLAIVGMGRLHRVATAHFWKPAHLA